MEKIAGIFADTPFQLTTALNIAKNYCKADGCFLFLTRKLYKTNREFVVETNNEYIKDIFYIQEYKEIGAIKHRMLRIKGLLTGHTSKNYPNFFCYFEKKPSRIPKLDFLIVNKYESVIAEEYKEIYRRNIPTYIIEDGVGDYTCQPTEIGKEAKRLYYWPEYFTENFQLEAYQAPSIRQDDVFLSNLLDDIFDISKDEVHQLNKCKCIYLHQPYGENDESSTRRENFMCVERKLLDVLKEVYGDSLYIKLHPRDNLDQFNEFNKLNSSASWEVLMNHLPDISNAVLISVNSTALLTPKMCFDEEPKIIVLNDIWQGNQEKNAASKRICDLFMQLKKRYQNKDRIFIPTSETELFSNIKKFLND